jgi:hypothetical protein
MPPARVTRTLAIGVVLLAACTSGGGHPTISPPSPGATPTSSSPSPRIVNETLQVASRRGLLKAIERVAMFRHAVVLAVGRPFVVQIWGSGAHFHAKTRYHLNGQGIVTVVQASHSGLIAAGRSATIRGRVGVIYQGVFYWTERGYSLALDPGTRQLASMLRWLSTS